MANCPCQVHTASRGHDWVVFRRQPDRTPTLYYEQTESESEEEDHEEDDDEGPLRDPLPERKTDRDPSHKLERPQFADETEQPK